MSSPARANPTQSTPATDKFLPLARDVPLLPDSVKNTEIFPSLNTGISSPVGPSRQLNDATLKQSPQLPSFGPPAPSSVSPMQPTLPKLLTSTASTQPANNPLISNKAPCAPFVPPLQLDPIVSTPLQLNSSHQTAMPGMATSITQTTQVNSAPVQSTNPLLSNPITQSQTTAENTLSHIGNNGSSNLTSFTSVMDYIVAKFYFYF